MKIIAWAYMVELESGLSKKQTMTLLERMPNEIEEFIPFTNDLVMNGSPLLEANSIAYGFLDNEYEDELDDVQGTLAAVCNDWELEKEDFLYPTKSGYGVLLLHDGHGKQINIGTLFD